VPKTFIAQGEGGKIRKLQKKEDPDAQGKYAALMEEHCRQEKQSGPLAEVWGKITGTGVPVTSR